MSAIIGEIFFNENILTICLCELSIHFGRGKTQGSSQLQSPNAYIQPDAPNVLQPLSDMPHERQGDRMINLGLAMYQCKMSRTSCFTLVRTLSRRTLRNRAFCGPGSVLREYSDDLGGSSPLVR